MLSSGIRSDSAVRMCPSGHCLLSQAFALLLSGSSLRLEHFQPTLYCPMTNFPRSIVNQTIQPISSPVDTCLYFPSNV